MMEESVDNDKDEEKNGLDRLPKCTVAPSAEHGRAHDNGEPCDDGRAGVFDQD